jgi:FlaA1/EpsC-like NDP-sugar epimerase
VRGLRYAVILGWDAAATCAALFLAFLLRFEGSIPGPFVALMLQAMPLLAVARIAAIMLSRMHRWPFRMAGFSEALRLAGTNVAGSALFLVAFAVVSPQGLPRSVLALEFFLATSLMAGARFAPRVAFGWYSQQQRARRGAVRRTLVVGAGSAGDLLVRDLLRSTDHPYEVAGFVDDDPGKQGMWLSGRPVLGRVSDLGILIGRHRASMVMLAIQRLPAQRIREVLQLCSSHKASFKIISTSFGRHDGRGAAAMLHDLSPEDLLPRDVVSFDEVEVRALLEGRRVLVTGGAGSIGSEIARQAAVHGVGLLVLADMDENGMYLLARRLREDHPGLDVRTEVADVRDAARVLQLGERYRPQDVFHAAAHKHVPLME